MSESTLHAITIASIATGALVLGNVLQKKTPNYILYIGCFIIVFSGIKIIEFLF